MSLDSTSKESLFLFDESIYKPSFDRFIADSVKVCKCSCGIWYFEATLKRWEAVGRLHNPFQLLYIHAAAPVVSECGSGLCFRSAAGLRGMDRLASLAGRLRGQGRVNDSVRSLLKSIVDVTVPFHVVDFAHLLLWFVNVFMLLQSSTPAAATSSGTTGCAQLCIAVFQPCMHRGRPCTTSPVCLNFLATTSCPRTCAAYCRTNMGRFQAPCASCAV